MMTATEAPRNHSSDCTLRDEARWPHRDCTCDCHMPAWVRRLADNAKVTTLPNSWDECELREAWGK